MDELIQAKVVNRKNRALFGARFSFGLQSEKLMRFLHLRLLPLPQGQGRLRHRPSELRRYRQRVLQFRILQQLLLRRPVLGLTYQSIPLGGIDTKETVMILTEYAHLVRRALSKRLDIKFLPKLTFVEDNSFEYAEKIEKIIKENKKNDKEKKRYN